MKGQVGKSKPTSLTSRTEPSYVQVLTPDHGRSGAKVPKGKRTENLYKTELTLMRVLRKMHILAMGAVLEIGTLHETLSFTVL